ncbi:MAG: hypothetical protein AUK44_05430 [Porphyromonadaceae bacterium CG2_30_38_12]|nr:MAG: hypothetical protein AUK44_05430 [Porphyromonadaceae bacterium CG2_30_38_12]
MQAQNKKLVADSAVVKASFRGVRLDVDIVPLVSSFLYHGERYNYEAALVADMKHKYFPTIEIGYGGANKSTLVGFHFKDAGVFTRLGVDFSLVKPPKDKKPSPNLFFAGMRLAFSTFTYSYSNLVIQDNYWGQQVTKDFNDIRASKLWFELTAGMRVEVVKNIFMGWTVRRKILLNQDELGNVYPWYIPGFGLKGEGQNWGVNYALCYKF